MDHSSPALSGPLPLTRREAVQRILALAALSTAMHSRSWGEQATPGLGWDPDLLKKEIPWPRLLTAAEKRAATALADLMLPADEYGPAASSVGVPDFIDEWISAPYEPQVKDRKVIREGLAWLDEEAQKRFKALFADATAAQQAELADEILKEGTDARKRGRAFFLLFRDRASSGYFTTTEGWKAIGYTGNVPSPEFTGPPKELLERLGLA